MISMFVYLSLCSFVRATMFFFLSIRRPPRSTRTDTLFPTRRSSDLLAPELSSMNSPGDEQAFQQWLDDAVLTPMDLEHGPMLRAWILAQETDRHRLVLAIPHLIVDGWSLQLIALEQIGRAHV